MQATRAVWVNLQAESEPAPQLDRASTSLSPLVTQILHNRGISADGLPVFLNPQRMQSYDPDLLRGMRAAIGRLQQARAAGETVAVCGDSDVDGITGAAVLVDALTLAGINAIPCLPPRGEGSCLQGEELVGLPARGIGLLITADCGITDATEIEALGAAGLEVIVTDHHTPPGVLPPALAIVNPQQPGCRYPCKLLAGVGVAYKVGEALLRSQGLAAAARGLLDLVAIGTVADMVPLVDEDRMLVWHGLRVLNDTSRPGLQAVVARSGLRLGSISATDVGYRLCPRLNAAGRLDQASLGYELLAARTYPEADALAQRLEEKNAARQHLMQEAMAAAHDELARNRPGPDTRLLIVPIAPGASGVMGLLAGKLMEEYGKPVVVLFSGGSEVRGSGRGTAAFGMLDALRANADLLLRYGGHQLAAGFTIRPEDVPRLAERLQRRAAELRLDGDARPVLRVDAEVAPGQLSWALYDQLQALEPCGVGNPLPLFLCRHMRVFEFRQVGNNHLRLTVGRGDRRFPAIVYRRGDLANYLRRNIEVDIVFHLEANDWNGTRSLQLRVRDMAFEPSGMQDFDGEGSTPAWR